MKNLLQQREEQNFSLAHYVYIHSLHTPNNLAISGDGIEITYGAFAEMARRISASLQQHSSWKNVVNGTVPRVGILASRSIDACIGLMGASWAGATYIPVGLKSPEDRLVNLLGQCQLSALICDTQGALLLTERVQAACPSLVLLPNPDHALPGYFNRKLTFLDLHGLPSTDTSSQPKPIPPQRLPTSSLLFGNYWHSQGSYDLC